MDQLVLFNNTTRNSLLKKRPKESKFGQHIKTLTSVSNIYEQLLNLDVSYVLIGLPEDVGVFANHGKPGTSNTFNAVIKILLNTQNNQFIEANKVLILGHLNFTDALNTLKKLNPSKKRDITKARKLVEKIDTQVSNVVHTIVKAGKIPIIIGGGHNNAYGNIKGTSLALGTPINIINLDAHTDFREEEGRHSGNGFSYAFAEGFLGNYFIFGLHENYTSQNIFNKIHKLKNITYNTFEDIAIRKKLKFKSEMKRALKHVSSKPFGIEIDCDAIEGITSSAMTPSGFSVNKTRAFVDFFAKHKNASYIHICEAVSTPENETQIGKLISYLITDFIKANGR